MLDPLEITTGFSAQRVSAALKRCARNAKFVEQWIDEHAAKTGIPKPSFENIYYGKSPPGLARFMQLVAHFGPGFASDVLRPSGVVCVKADDYRIIQSAEFVKALPRIVTILEGMTQDAKEVAQLKVAAE